jgi:hypothetical protein
MWESILVGLIVLAAVLYAIWRMLPAGLRLRAAHRVGEWGQHPGRPAWSQRASAAVAAAARRGVGACSDCSAVQAEPTTPSTRKPRA